MMVTFHAIVVCGFICAAALIGVSRALVAIYTYDLSPASDQTDERSSWFGALRHYWPIPIVGLLFQCITSQGGAPTPEWVAPLIFAVLTIDLIPNRVRGRTAALFTVGIFLLCYHGMLIREANYTSAPARTVSTRYALNDSLLRMAVKEVEAASKSSPDGLPEGTNRIPTDFTVDEILLSPEWHTILTGLLRINTVPRRVWVVKEGQELKAVF